LKEKNRAGMKREVPKRHMYLNEEIRIVNKAVGQKKAEEWRGNQKSSKGSDHPNLTSGGRPGLREMLGNVQKGGKNTISCQEPSPKPGATRSQ